MIACSGKSILFKISAGFLAQILIIIDDKNCLAVISHGISKYEDIKPFQKHGWFWIKRIYDKAFTKASPGVLTLQKHFFGVHREEGVPDLIPNSEIKLFFAHDTAVLKHFVIDALPPAFNSETSFAYGGNFAFTPPEQF